VKTSVLIATDPLNANPYALKHGVGARYAVPMVWYWVKEQTWSHTQEGATILSDEQATALIAGLKAEHPNITFHVMAKQ